MRIAICDDMLIYREQIKEILDQWPERPDGLQIEAFEDADSLLTAHGGKPFDIILMDVIMPLLNGIEAAAELRQQDKAVKLVFLTSSKDFAVDSYAVKADNYLLKPIQADNLYRCLNELAEELREKAKVITVKSIGAIRRVEIQSIEYIEAQNKHVFFSLVDGRSIESVDPLYTYEKQLLLSDGFFKCNRSYIVNIRRIDTYTPKEIKTYSGYRIPISRSCQKEFEAAYFEVLFGKAGDW